jgi:hypothetical protein
VFDGAGAVVVWAQSLPTTTKGFASLVIVAIFVFLLILLWQRPPEVKTEKQGTGTANLTGNVASSGQSGGITAGQYIIQSPPVTEQQKAQALSSLRSERASPFPKPRRCASAANTIGASNSTHDGTSAFCYFEQVL